jgi:putative holliday junction resolvase
MVGAGGDLPSPAAAQGTCPIPHRSWGGAEPWQPIEKKATGQNGSVMSSSAQPPSPSEGSPVGTVAPGLSSPLSPRLPPPVTGSDVTDRSVQDTASVPATVESMQPTWPAIGALAAVDHGTKRIGLAVCDPDRRWAMPLEMVPMARPDLLAKSLQRVASDYRIKGWIVGLPLHMDGRESRQSQLVRTFGTWLAEATRLPVEFWDERLTSSAAESLLWERGESPSRRKHSGVVDGLAAQMILQSYLDQHRPPQAQPAPPLDAPVSAPDGPPPAALPEESAAAPVQPDPASASNDIRSAIRSDIPG